MPKTPIATKDTTPEGNAFFDLVDDAIGTALETGKPEISEVLAMLGFALGKLAWHSEVEGMERQESINTVLDVIFENFKLGLAEARMREEAGRSASAQHHGRA